MSRTALPIITVLDSFPTLPLTALSLDFVWTAADVANGNAFPSTGKEIVIANNTGGSGYTITVPSVVDAYNRPGDITTYAIAAGLYSVFPYFNAIGWRQTDGNIYISASNAAVKFAVLRLPH